MIKDLEKSLNTVGRESSLFVVGASIIDYSLILVKAFL